MEIYSEISLFEKESLLNIVKMFSSNGLYSNESIKPKGFDDIFNNFRASNPFLMYKKELSFYEELEKHFEKWVTISKQTIKGSQVPQYLYNISFSVDEKDIVPDLKKIYSELQVWEYLNSNEIEDLILGYTDRFFNQFQTLISYYLRHKCGYNQKGDRFELKNILYTKGFFTFADNIITFVWYTSEE